MRPVLVAPFLLVLCTCVVESVEPLTPAASAVLDKSLLGTWSGLADGETTPIDAQISASPSGLVRIRLNGSKGRESMSFEGHVSVLDGLRLLNLRALDGAERDQGYLFVRYALIDGELEVWLLRMQPVIDAINEGQLAGRRTQYGGVALRDTAENLRRFMASKKPDVLFERLALFRKR